jgi:phenylacetate-coenzyme A ligase PaaK-like adenylate-forming protein
VSAAVRVCFAAAEAGLDIAGTTFRVGGEPLTGAKAQVIAAHGCDVIANYSMAELGKVGVACADPAALDDMHLLTDKLGLLQTPRPPRPDGSVPTALHLTTLHARATRLLINVETGDEGVVVERRCACAFGELGLHLHLHGVRSYEKLTTEGGTFLGHDLVELVEVELPAAFGGCPTDYQFVEDESDGPSRLRLIVSPRVGELDEAAVVEAVVERLGRRGIGERLTAQTWRGNGTITLERRDPTPNGSLKVQPLRTVSP